MNCKDCKYWGDRSELNHLNRTSLECLGLKVCSKVVNHSDWDPIEIGGVKAVTVDHEEYASALITQSNFGCVLFEGKEGL